MRKRFFFAAIVALFALTGCSFNRHRGADHQANARGQTIVTNASGGISPILTLENGLNGRVSSVNQNLKFAVLTFPIGQMPARNQRLFVYEEGMRVGELNVTGPQRDDSTVADIIAGEARPGDEVRDR